MPVSPAFWDAPGEIHLTHSKPFRWAATRLRFLTPGQQLGWTQHRLPLKPAPRSLADMLGERDQPE